MNECILISNKAHCSNCVVCNRAKPSRHGSSSLSPLDVPNYPWEIIGMDFVTDLPKRREIPNTISMLF